VEPSESVVRAGTHVLLELVNALNTGKSKDGDRVYLRTAVPVAVNNRVVIPRGSDVAGTIVATKPARGKRDLYIRFDTLTLPDGTARDLRARPDGGKEGKVAGQTDGPSEARTVATGAGIGASIGGIAGAAAGNAGAGLGIGGLAGAAAGLASVMSKRQDITLRPGTHVDMVLDRDLRF
jgi:type IV secretion system protein VirB10